jgi:competence protein ComEC
MPKKIVLILFLLIILHWLWISVTRWQLPVSIIQQSVLIDGVISSIPQKKFRGESFVFHVNQFNHQKTNTRFLIAWYRHPSQLQVGQHWQFFVKLKPPIGSQNPGGFNYADFLIHQGISATGYVVAQDQNQLLSEKKLFLIDRLREKIQQHISAAIANHTIAAFICALCVGLRDGLTQSDWQVFQKTGTNHLVAIAGLHIGFVVAAIYFLIDKIVRLFPRLLLRMPASQIAQIAALCAAILYSALSGFAIPAQRASIMLFILMISNIIFRNVSMWYRWFFAMMIILMVNPYDYGDASFWLSFISVGLLVWVMSDRLQSPSHLISWGKMQMTMVIGLMPLMFWFFQQVSIVSFMANAIAIPWVGFIILPIALSACVMCVFHLFWMSQTLFWLSGKCLYPLWKILFFLSHVSFSSWHHAFPNIIVLLMGMIGVMILLAPRGFPAKWLGCFAFLPVFFYHSETPSFGNFNATVIDVGQGLSVLIQTKNHVMLYDTGAHFPGGFDFGESVVTPYLREQGVSTIDRLEISHGDNDHSGGAEAIVKNFRVNHIFTSAPKLVSHFHGHYCDSTQQWVWDGVRFATFSPEPNMPYDDNNSSCVIKVTGKNGQLLLTGDIQRETESQLVERYGNQLDATVLIVPHHGSRTSSSDAFISAVSPQYAVISAGKYNRYHLPVESVVDRYKSRHIILYDTADTGAVNIRFLRTGQVKLHSFRLG